MSSPISVPSLSPHDAATLKAKAEQLTSLEFLDGFATKCAAAGLTLEETLAAYSGVEKAAALFADPHKLSGFIDAVAEGGGQ
jgi:hypothetical protein